MSSGETYQKYIVLNSQGVPVIKGTQTKVVELVSENLFWGWDAEEIHRQHPYLTLEQTEAAIAYYAAHREELNQNISNRLEYVKKMRESAGPSQFAQKLKAKGLL